jgi:hypothetical protein
MNAHLAHVSESHAHIESPWWLPLAIFAMVIVIFALALGLFALIDHFTDKKP